VTAAASNAGPADPVISAAVTTPFSEMVSLSVTDAALPAAFSASGNGASKKWISFGGFVSLGAGAS
jgi:hypothetical protein